MSLYDIQKEKLDELKVKSFDELLSLVGRTQVKDKRLLKGQKLEIEVIDEDGVLVKVRSLACDLPSLGEDEEREMANILGADFPAKTESIEWHNGFDMDKEGHIFELHSDEFDD